MGYSYGIEQCRETLLILSSDATFDDRIASAFSEIGVIRTDDVSKKHYSEIGEWRKRYLSIRDFAVSIDGALIETDKLREFSELANELVWICVYVIEHNSRNTKK